MYKVYFAVYLSSQNLIILEIFIVFCDFVCVYRKKEVILQKFHTIISKIIENGGD